MPFIYNRRPHVGLFLRKYLCLIHSEFNARWSAVNFGRTFSHPHTESSRRRGCDAGRRDTGGQLRFNVLLEIIHVTWLADVWRPPVLAKVRFQQ